MTKRLLTIVIATAVALSGCATLVEGEASPARESGEALRSMGRPELGPEPLIA